MYQGWFDGLWKKLKHLFVIALVVLFAVMVITVYVSYEWGIWHECLRDHSWFYCHRIL